MIVLAAGLIVAGLALLLLGHIGVGLILLGVGLVLFVLGGYPAGRRL